MKQLYNKIKSKSPLPIRSLLMKASFALTKKPFAEPPDISRDKNFSNKKKDAFLVISADFELGWAFRYSKQNPYPEKMARRARENFPFLLRMFEKYDIPITWATVGHLFLKQCKKGEHDWMHRIPYFENRNWLYNKGDWFDCDPYTYWEKAKAWYAPDLIESILKSKVKHEIGCHSFSHIDLTYKNCPSEVAEDEIKACIEATKVWGIKLKSFVFPGGTYGNFEFSKTRPPD